jgi:hypothetical protein
VIVASGPMKGALGTHRTADNQNLSPGWVLGRDGPYALIRICPH